MSQTKTITGLKDSLDKLNTGDILLFGGSNYWFSNIVRYWTKSQFSHVGIILRDPIYINPKLKGLYLWESGLEHFVDSEDGVRKLGVQITSMDKVLKYADESDLNYLVYRKLHTSLSELEIINKIKDIHNVVHNRPYDINIYDFLEARCDVTQIESKEKPSTNIWSNWFKPNHRRNDTYFCSALVGFIYTELGLLPSNTKWTECSPEFYSSEENPKMKLTNGNYLDVDKLIYKNPNIK
jgi:hypothetical protein